MNINIPKFVFKNRRYIHIAVAILPIPFKVYFEGTSTLLLWIVGFLLMLSGIAFRIYTAGYLQGKHTTTKIIADYMCTSGPFAYIRNPLYLGNFIIGLSLAVAFNEWYGYLLFAIHYTCVYSILIFYEEKFMAKKFGAAYAEYRAQTRRFIPRLKPFKGSSRITPDFKIGFWSEKYYFLLLLILFALLYILFVS
jgi:protein-S-isoprenylcysteine O-methyltransferase Ste14